jgi:hypothetical protein
MKIRKNIVTFLMILGILSINLSVSHVYAVDKKENKVQIITVSEYDMYKETINKTDEELLEEGYTLEQTKELREKDFVEELKTRSKLDEKDLKDMGYDEEQIKILKNFSGTEAELYALSAKAEIKISEVCSSKSSDVSKCKITVRWDWTHCPMWLYTDIAAVGWTDGMYCDTSDDDNRVILCWHNKYNNKVLNISDGRMIADTNKGVYVKHDIGRAQFSAYLKSGIMYITVKKKALVKEMAFIAKYGHSQVTGNPSVTLSKNGATMGIQFSRNVKVMDVDDKYIEL